MVHRLRIRRSSTCIRDYSDAVPTLIPTCCHKMITAICKHSSRINPNLVRSSTSQLCKRNKRVSQCSKQSFKSERTYTCLRRIRSSREIFTLHHLVHLALRA